MENRLKSVLRTVWNNPSLILVLSGFVLLMVPVYWNLANTVWWRDEQGHGPVICLVAWYLVWKNIPQLVVERSRSATVTGMFFFLISLIFYFVGHSQAIDTLEVFSLVLLLAALTLMMSGWRSLRKLAFPLIFMLFMVPLPGILVQAVTLPMKILVSQVAGGILSLAAYPIARSGVVLSVGQYQILVADACAGLNTLFTLESIGILYMYLNPIGSRLRNVLLGFAIVPIAFLANVIRVIVLILITYHLGDAAGQGFMHQFAGLLLFGFALLLLFVMDGLLSRIFPAGTHA
ncbi:exosortase B [Aquitalea sp. LB_tupeE]|uniref:exosortase B n=1 Tax=Aquitalea sp. LB_tupeE TaxID=2748078 RepID=UPI0015C1BAD8|nr:exosortase B [Aquitalea sp. LB_tupeE]NWK79434.1 exosortase B [Aquitalea sp. LB_tupeE]